MQVSPRVLFSLLLLVAGCCQAANTKTTTTTTTTTPLPTSSPTTSHEPTSTSTTSTTSPDPSISTTAKSSTTTPEGATLTPGDEVVGEVGRLLTQLRQVASSLQQAREEHERLATAVAQVTAAVRDMGEHNLHIKKKVRKMSKGLKRSSHNKKIKEGLKALQRDHQRILHAITLNSNLSRSHSNHSRSQHTSQHRPRGGRKGHNHPRPTTHPAHSNTTTKPRRQGKGEKNREKVVSEPKVVTQKEALTAATEVKGDNVIPELVVDPPSPTDPPLPADCTEVMHNGNWTSGVYMVQPPGIAPIKVWCDHSTSGGGWTVMLARLEQPDQEDFVKGWSEYKAGFGDPSGEHWLGLDAIHAMTKGRIQELRVNITDWHNNSVWAEWKEFSVGGESENYKLTVVRYASGSEAGDALKWHNGMKFSTPDRDNDFLLGGHCAAKNDGGWWYRGYRGCYHAHPTGRYQHNPGDPPKTSVTSRNFELGPVLVWQNWRGESYYPRTLFLMFRPGLN